MTPHFELTVGGRGHGSPGESSRKRGVREAITADLCPRTGGQVTLRRVYGAILRQTASVGLSRQGTDTEGSCPG